MNKIICYGEILWDLFPTGAHPGGAPLNVAFHLKKQGLNPILVSKTGRDDPGRQLLSFLKQSGIGTDYIQTGADLPTGRVQVYLDENRNARFEICEPAAWDYIVFTPELRGLVDQADWIIFGTLASRNKTSRNTLLQMIENTGAQLFLDVNLRPPYNGREITETLLQKADMVKLNHDELAEISQWNRFAGDEKKQIQCLSRQYGCPTVCVTRGANGAILYSGDNFFEHPGFKVEAKDTVGAGDAFTAAYISALIQKKPPGEALRFACATGALVASKTGAVPVYSVSEIEKISGN